MDWENLKKEGCLNLTIAEWNPFTIFLNATPPYKVMGSTIDIINIIAERLGFCYTLVRGKDTDWGMELPDGTWSGSVGILHRGEASMSATVYSVSLGRTKAIDFGDPVYIDDQTAAYKRPTLGSDVLGFVKPFNYELWLYILGGIILVYLALVTIQYAHNAVIASSELSESEKKKEMDVVGFTHCQWSFSNLIDQSVAWEPSGIPVRAIAGIWILMAFIISIFYRSSLRALLITPKITLPFNDFRELAQTDLKVWAPFGSRFHSALNSAEEGSKLEGITENVILTRNTTEGPDGFYSGKWGIIDVRKAVIYYLHHDFSMKSYCQSYIIEDGVLRTTPLAFGYPKGSTLRGKVNRILQGLREGGITDHLFTNRVINASECLKPIGKGMSNVHRSLEFKDFYGMFAIYLGGIVLSLLAFGGEMIAKTCRKDLYEQTLAKMAM